MANPVNPMSCVPTFLIKLRFIIDISWFFPVMAGGKTHARQAVLFNARQRLKQLDETRPSLLTS
jgi:hypothetical protein